MINYQKDFDLHITVDLETSGLFKARSIFGSSLPVVYDYDDKDEVHWFVIWLGRNFKCVCSKARYYWSVSEKSVGSYGD
jgi:hypothetical protein